MLHLRRHHRPQVSTRYGQGRFRGGGPRLRGFGGEGSRGRSGERCRTIHATQHQTASVSFPPSSSPGGSCRPTHISRYAETQPCHPLPPGRLNPRTSRNSVETSRNVTSFTSSKNCVVVVSKPTSFPRFSLPPPLLRVCTFARDARCSLDGPFFRRHLGALLLCTYCTGTSWYFVIVSKKVSILSRCLRELRNAPRPEPSLPMGTPPSHR